MFSPSLRDVYFNLAAFQQPLRALHSEPAEKRTPRNDRGVWFIHDG